MTNTTYDSQRIQQEGRHIQIGEEAQVITGKHGQGKRKTPEQKERQRLQKYEYRKQNREKIRLYNVKKHAAKKQLIEASKIANEKQRQTAMAFKIYEQSQINDIRMHNSKKIFPDWGYLIYKEKQKEIMKTRYRNMTENEKRIFLENQQSKRCSIKMAKYAACYRRKYPEKIKQSQNNWLARNKDKVIEYRRKARKNPKNRAKFNLRDRFKDLMKTVKKGGSTSFSKTIGCTTSQLSIHLESQLSNGMTWDNYGTHWHVDHIIPCASFNHNDPKQVAQCWHWTNLRPLLAKDNLEKSDAITLPQLNLMLNFC